MNYFKENLRNRRIIVGMSQNDLAEKMHVSRQTISNWELGKNEPNLDDLIRLS